MAKSKKSIKFTPDYDVSDIQTLYEMRKTDNKELRVRTIATAMRELCRMEHKVKIPDTYKSQINEVRTPFIRDAWHRITSSMIAKQPIVHVIPKDEKREDYREAANIAERADLAMLEKMNKERGIDIIYNLQAQHTRDGASVLKIVHRKDAWANFPMDATVEDQDDYKKGASLPIAWRDVDRLSCVFDDGEYGDEWVIEYGEYPKKYLSTRYRMREEGNRLVDPARILEGYPTPEGYQASSNGMVTKVEFFNAKEWHVIIDGSEAPGWPKPNPYSPYLPYFKAESYDSESLLYSLLYLVPRLDEILTMKLNWSFIGSYPNPVLETQPSGAGYMGLDSPTGEPLAADEQPFMWVPGKAIEVPIGKKFSFAGPPPVGRDLNELAQMFKSLIDIAGIPSIMRGMSMSGDTGYLANQQMAAASMAYRLSVISSQRQLERGFDFSHWLISKVVKQRVYFYGWSSINSKTGSPTKKAQREWLCLDPDSGGNNRADLSKVSTSEVKFRPTLPTDEQARAMIALQLTNAQNPLYDLRSALEKWMQEEDPDGIIENLRVQNALDQEPLKSLWTNKGLQKAGIIPPDKPNPASQLVNPQGQALLPPGPNDLQGVPLAAQSVAGGPSVRGVNQPIVGGGGRPAGTYPGQPSNQGG